MMDKKEEDPSMQQDEMDSEKKPSVNRIEILNKVESGEMEISEAIDRLKSNKEPEKKIDILDQLEQGHIDVEEALHRLEGTGTVPTGEAESAEASSASSGARIAPRKWHDWWLVILASALAVIAIGGWLGTVGGWWWLCATPGLIVGFVLLVLALASRNAPWIHLRVDTGQKTWPRHIALSLPLPIRLASWGLKTWGPRIPNLNETAVDELILALEGNLSKDTPIYIDVQEDESTGERVQIFLG
jgi:hypothetical protein